MSSDDKQQASITVEMQAKSFQGRVLVFVTSSRGGGIEGATVSLNGPIQDQADTNANHVAEFGNVPVGNYEVRVTHPQHEDTTAQISEGDFGA